ncbi:adenylate kinase [bacterium]|nr:adenylate kinase [bacterium]
MRVVLMGPPGAGKGTQAKKVVGALDLAHVSTGDMFRRMVAAGGDLGKRIQAIIGQGHLVPDKETSEVVDAFLTQESLWDSFMLDGFPRTVPQAEMLDAMLARRKKSLDAVVAIDLSEQNVLARLGGRRSCLACGSVYHEVSAPPKKPGVCDRDGKALQVREDDKPDKIRERLRIYESQTQPLLDYYAKSGVLKRVPGDAEADEVAGRILAVLRGQR